MAELVLPSGAIKIIQSQQQLVGGAIAGSAGAVGGNGANPDIDVLKEIKELAFKSFKKTTQIAKTLADSLAFEKNQTRRKNDQSAELSKESGGGGDTSVGSKSHNTNNNNPWGNIDGGGAVQLTSEDLHKHDSNSFLKFDEENEESIANVEMKKAVEQ